MKFLKKIYFLLPVIAIAIFPPTAWATPGIVASGSLGPFNFPNTTDSAANFSMTFTLPAPYAITGIALTGTGLSYSLQGCHSSGSCAPHTVFTIDGTDYLNFGDFFLYNGTFATPISLSAGSHTVVWTYDGTSNRSTMFSTAGGGGTTISGYAVYADTPTVSLNFPTSTANPDFSNWKVDWSTSPQPPAGQMHVHYGLSSSSMPYDDVVDFSPFVSANPLPIPKSQNLWFPPMSIPATWYVQVEDVGASSTVSSAITSFTVSPIDIGTTSSTPAFTTTDCNITSSTFLADPIGNIQAGICSSLTYLFIPDLAHQDSLNNALNNLKSAVAHKPPFGYFNLASTEVGTLGSTATTTRMLNASDTAMLTAGPFGRLDEIAASMLWLLLMFFVLNRARHIQL